MSWLAMLVGLACLVGCGIGLVRALRSPKADYEMVRTHGNRDEFAEVR